MTGYDLTGNRGFDNRLEVEPCDKGQNTLDQFPRSFPIDQVRNKLATLPVY